MYQDRCTPASKETLRIVHWFFIPIRYNESIERKDAMKQLELKNEWYRAVKTRVSTRLYMQPPDDERLQALVKLAAEVSGDGVCIKVLRGPVFHGLLNGGNIRGTDCFAALVSDANVPAEVVGYRGEAFVLGATAMNVGTCWLGASMDRALCTELAEVKNGAKMRCIVSLGLTDAPLDDEQSIIRKRKPLTELTGKAEQSLSVIPIWQQRALECAQAAPSAVNGQPWRFELSDTGIAIVCKSHNFGYGWVDTGIAMLHLELGAAHGGTICSFSKSKKRYLLSPNS